MCSGEEAASPGIGGGKAGYEAAIISCGTPLDPVTYFRYLARVLSLADGTWPAVFRNLWKAQRKWVWMMRVLSREGAYART